MLLIVTVCVVIIVTKADIVPLDQELQTQIPTGARWITQLKQSNAAVNRSHLKAAIGAQLHPIVP